MRASEWPQVIKYGRGSVGEMALHLLYLLAPVTPGHKRMSRIVTRFLNDSKTKDEDGKFVFSLDATCVLVRFLVAGHRRLNLPPQRTSRP